MSSPSTLKFREDLEVVEVKHTPQFFFFREGWEDGRVRKVGVGGWGSKEGWGGSMGEEERLGWEVRNGVTPPLQILSS